MDRKLDWKAEAKIPKATDAAKHKAGGGNVEICWPHTHNSTAGERPCGHMSCEG